MGAPVSRSAFMTFVAGVAAVLATACSGSGSETEGPARCQGCVVRSVVGWTKDSHSVVFTASSPDAKGRRYVVGADAAGLRRLAKGQRRPTRVWTQSRERVASVKDGSIQVRSRGGRVIGSPTSSCFEDACYDDVTDSEPSWSPNGRWILFTRSVYDVCGFCFFPDVSSFTALGVAHPDGTGFHWVMAGEEADDDTSGSWSPDGRRVAFVRGGSLYVVDVDRRGEAIALPRRIVIP